MPPAPSALQTWLDVIDPEICSEPASHVNTTWKKRRRKRKEGGRKERKKDMRDEHQNPPAYWPLLRVVVALD